MVAKQGVRFVPIYGRQAFKVNNRFKFWGGLTVEAWGGGPGPGRCAQESGPDTGIPIVYHARALSLLHDDDGVQGLTLRHEGKTRDRAVPAPSSWPAGGFESNPEWRTRYLGPGWDLAKVRGTRFNTGDGIRMALDVRRSASRQLVRLPRRGLGPQCARVWRSRSRRRLSEALLSLGHHAQRQR